MTAEECREAIAKARGIPIELVPLIDFEAEKARMRAQHEKVSAIIEASKKLLAQNPKTTADKYEELYDIGKFIVFFDDNFKILPAIQEYPDFTLVYDDYTIGVEHTRLWNNKKRAMFKAAKHYIAKAEEALKDLSHLSKTVNIYIDFNQNVISDGNFENRKFTKEQREQIPQIIAGYIRSRLTGGNVTMPAFIQQVEITRNEDFRVDLELGETYFTKTEFSAHLLGCISKKEEKADNYRNARVVDSLWLLIVLDDVNSFSGFNTELAILPEIKNSNFDSIVMFEKFTGNIRFLYLRH